MRTLALATTLLALTVTVAAQDQLPVFSADVELITLNVAVLDADAVPITDLTPADFTIVDDGEVRPVAIVLPPERTPLDIAILLDLSNSMRRQDWRRQAHDFLDALTARDCVFLLGFSTEVGGSAWGQPDSGVLRDALDDASAVGGTALYDALLVGLTELDRSQSAATLRSSTRSSLNPEGGDRMRRQAHRDNTCPVAPGSASLGLGASRRKAIIVVSDGLDSTSRKTAGDVRVAAQLGGIPLFPLRIRRDLVSRSGWRRRPRGADPRILEQLARLTGGQVVAADESGYAAVLSWLRGSYLVGYYRSEAGPGTADLEFSQHDVSITVARTGAEVLHRPSYYRATIDTAAARRDVADGIDLADHSETDAALLLFERAARSDPSYAPAYFHKALLLGAGGKLPAARASALIATTSGAGTAHFHRLAMLLSLDLGDSETAWEQAIRSAQAGEALDEHLPRLRAGGPAPEDLEARLAAPRVAVARTWAEATNLMIEASLSSILSSTRRALSDAPFVGLVTDPSLADYVVTIRGVSVSEELPRRFDGSISVETRAGDRVYRKGLQIDDIGAPQDVESSVSAHIAAITDVLRQR